MLWEAAQRKALLEATLNDSGEEEPKAVSVAATAASWPQLRGQVQDAADKIQQRLGDNERMLLHRMSSNNRYFLFEDKQQRAFKVYELKNQTSRILGGSSLFPKRASFRK